MLLMCYGTFCSETIRRIRIRCRKLCCFSALISRVSLLLTILGMYFHMKAISNPGKGETSQGKQLLKTLGKHYIIDLGFRNMLLGYRDADRGHILENIVFLEMLRRDYRVYIGKVGDTEVDFVAERPNDKLYIQVTESMRVPETRERELRPLQMISDNYEKIVLSMDRDYINSYEGIKALNLIDWLLS